MRALVALVAAFVLGILVTNATHTPEVDYVEGPTKTKTVREPAPDPIEIKVVPESCLAVMRFAKVVADRAADIYAASDEQLDIISFARMTLADGGDLSVAENRQRDLQGNTVGSLYELEEALYNFEITYEKCEEERD